MFKNYYSDKMLLVTQCHPENDKDSSEFDDSEIESSPQNDFYHILLRQDEDSWAYLDKDEEKLLEKQYLREDRFSGRTVRIINTIIHNHNENVPKILENKETLDKNFINKYSFLLNDIIILMPFVEKQFRQGEKDEEIVKDEDRIYEIIYNYINHLKLSFEEYLEYMKNELGKEKPEPFFISRIIFRKSHKLRKIVLKALKGTSKSDHHQVSKLLSHKNFENDLVMKRISPLQIL